MRKQRQRNRFSFGDQYLDAATRLSARRFEVVFSENPQLWRFNGAKRGHRVIAEWRPEDKILALLAYLGLCVRQNKMRIIAMDILVPRLIAVLGSYRIETLETLGETAFEYRFRSGCYFKCFRNLLLTMTFEAHLKGNLLLVFVNDRNSQSKTDNNKIDVRVRCGERRDPAALTTTLISDPGTTGASNS